MTTPPPEPPEGGWPPPGYPNCPPYGPYPPYPPPRKESSAGLVVGLAAAGAFAYFVVNFVVAILVLMLASGPTSGNVILAGAIGLALFAFGVGGVLVALRKPWALGLGLGLMIGWALTSIGTVGICTGINPSIYGGL